MHLAEDGSALLLLDTSGRVSWWALVGDDAPRLVVDIAAPAALLVPQGGGATFQPELGFLPSGLPWLGAGARDEAARPVALHPGLQAWVAMDVWRYAESPLQCRAPCTCPRAGPLSELLGGWHRPALPSAWSAASPPQCGGGSADETSYLSHVARRSQLDHELALCLVLGRSCGAHEAADCLRELSDYCEEAGLADAAAELAAGLRFAAGGDGGGLSQCGDREASPATAAARLLAGGLLRAGLQDEVRPLLRGTGSAERLQCSDK